MAEYVEPEFDTDIEHKRRGLVEKIEIESLRERPVFDHVADAIAAELGTTIAKVSLIDSDTQHLLAEKGLGVDEIGRAESVCNHPIATGELFVVENAAEHPALADNPYVKGKPYVRFYVGIPLIVESVPIGTICGVDTESKRLDWQSRSSVFRIVGLVERLLSAHVQSPDGEPTRNYELLEQLSSAEAHAVRLESSDRSSRSGKNAVTDLRAALHNAEEFAKSALGQTDSTGIGNAETVPDSS